MLYVLRQYKPATVTLEKGLENVLSIRDQFVDKENEKKTREGRRPAVSNESAEQIRIAVIQRAGRAS